MYPKYTRLYSKIRLGRGVLSYKNKPKNKMIIFAYIDIITVAFVSLVGVAYILLYYKQ